MESAYFHHPQHLFQQDEQILGFSASSPHIPSQTPHACNPTVLLSTHVNEVLPNHKLHGNQVPPFRTSQIEGKVFCDARSNPQSANSEVPYLPKFSETTYIPGTTAEEIQLISPSSSTFKHVRQGAGFRGRKEELMLGSFTSNHSDGDDHLYSSAQNPFWISSSMGISNTDPSWVSASSSLGLNLKALDYLSCSKNGNWNSSKPSSKNCHHGLNETAGFKNGVTRTRRQSGDFYHGESDSHTKAKKSRLQSRLPCPPLKVRKEKLGERISALHHLVAPFGKTDTASVLTEAIRYIQFLQDQIQTLTVPSMSKPFRTVQAGGVREDDEEFEQDLKSRGLCLVPMSCTSHVASYGT